MAKKKNNFYAVARGRKPGIYTEWFGESGAQRQIIRFKNPKYKGFVTREEAEAFMGNKSGSDENKKKIKPNRELSQRKFSDRIIIYTDGGCINNPGPGGYGAVILNNGNSKELSGGYRLTTNNRMELMACIVALNSLKKPTSVVLHSDSQYVVNGIEKGWAKSWRAKGWVKSDRKPSLKSLIK